MKNNITRDELVAKSQALKLEAEIAWNARNEEIRSFFNKLIKDNKLENHIFFDSSRFNGYEPSIEQLFKFSISSDDNAVWTILDLYFDGKEFTISYSSGSYVHFSNECYIAFAKLNSILVEYSSKIKSLEKSICSYNSIINAYWDSMREIDEFDKNALISDLKVGTFVKVKNNGEYLKVDHITSSSIYFKHSKDFKTVYEIPRERVASYVMEGAYKVLKRIPKKCIE